VCVACGCVCVDVQEMYEETKTAAEAAAPLPPSPSSPPACHPPPCSQWARPSPPSPPGPTSRPSLSAPPTALPPRQDRGERYPTTLPWPTCSGTTSTTSSSPAPATRARTARFGTLQKGRLTCALETPCPRPDAGTKMTKAYTSTTRTSS
jgi:hypothetical protein